MEEFTKEESKKAEALAKEKEKRGRGTVLTWAEIVVSVAVSLFFMVA
jgi:hypothetical protein